MTSLAAPNAPTAQEQVAAHQDDGNGALFGITELCTEFGISPLAIRFYEDKALLAPRRLNGTRLHDSTARKIPARSGNPGRQGGADGRTHVGALRSLGRATCWGRVECSRPFAEQRDRGYFEHPGFGGARHLLRIRV